MKNIGKYLTLATMALLSSDVSAQQTVPTIDDLDDFDTGIYSQQEKELMDIQRQINSKWSKLRKQQKAQTISARNGAIQDYRDMATDYTNARLDLADKYQKLSL